MEKLRAAGARQAYDVFDVRQTGSKSTDRGAIENTASRGEKPDDKTPTDDLEPPIPNVAMRHAITREMKRDAEYRRSCARAHGSADGRAGRGMERDNHAAVLAHEGHSPEASPRARTTSCGRWRRLGSSQLPRRSRSG